MNMTDYLSPQKIQSSFVDAIREGDIENVKLFFEKGVKINKADISHKTPLYEAVKNNHLEIVKYLVEKGAKINIESIFKITPLYEAVKNNYFEIVKYLIEKGANKEKGHGKLTPLYTATLIGNHEMVEYLLENGCDINYIDINGNSLLHIAAHKNDLKLAQIFFNWGIDLNIYNNDGDTPTVIANYRNYKEFANAIEAERIRRRDHGFKRCIKDDNIQPDTKRQRIEESSINDNNDDDDDNDDDYDDDNDDDN